jgi:hypothetical protein
MLFRFCASWPRILRFVFKKQYNQLFPIIYYLIIQEEKTSGGVTDSPALAKRQYYLTQKQVRVELNKLFSCPPAPPSKLFCWWYVGRGGVIEVMCKGAALRGLCVAWPSQVNMVYELLASEGVIVGLCYGHKCDDLDEMCQLPVGVSL